MSQGKARMIDQQESVRTRPMKVLVLGMCRTGTLSIYTALKQLGYRPYHMVEVGTDLDRTLGLWSEGLRAKVYGEGASFGRKEFDVLLGDYDAVSDVPCALFVDELTKAYPDAKVILTNRDVDKWMVSMHRTVWKVMRWPSWPILARFDYTFARPWYSFLQLAFKCLCDNDDNEIARQRYLEHYDHVRDVVPKGNLLEFRAEDGWGPLCAFLEQPVPESEYPNVNDSENFVAIHVKMRNISAMLAARNILRACLPVIAVGTAIYFGLFPPMMSSHTNSRFPCEQPQLPSSSSILLPSCTHIDSSRDWTINILKDAWFNQGLGGLLGNQDCSGGSNHGPSGQGGPKWAD